MMKLLMEKLWEKKHKRLELCHELCELNSDQVLKMQYSVLLISQMYYRDEIKMV